ncbi:hypothetical protein QYF61_012642 [Mycteria americana]|uniref:Reverse transcriptase RNase H-like domain-containing protein n=1 Tax=Mycteria americana TaxID=33587 RepID=A0AAN7MM03_MYCAM|nr:hypothetical protein QYF61_012642 [Mycteria americana]
MQIAPRLATMFETLTLSVSHRVGGRGTFEQVALGVLTQNLGSWKRPVGYFSKQLDEVSKGWPACLRAVAATATLIEKSRKLTLGQLITVFVPHAVSSLLENKGHHWISPSRLAKYQVVLLEQDDVVISLISALNPATLLISEKMMEILLENCTKKHTREQMH